MTKWLLMSEYMHTLFSRILQFVCTLPNAVYPTIPSLTYDENEENNLGVIEGKKLGAVPWIFAIKFPNQKHNKCMVLTLYTCSIFSENLIVKI